MILRATCEDVLRNIKAEVATNMPQAGAGKPDPAGASSVHVIAAAAALDGAGPHAVPVHFSVRGEPIQAYEGMAPTAWPVFNQVCSAGRA